MGPLRGNRPSRGRVLQARARRDRTCPRLGHQRETYGKSLALAGRYAIGHVASYPGQLAWLITLESIEGLTDSELTIWTR